MAAEVISSQVKDDGTGTTHDFVLTVPADCNYMRISISGTSMPDVSSVTHDNGGTNQTCTRPSGMSAVLENGDGHRLDAYQRVSPTTGSSKTLRVVFASSMSGAVIGVTYYKGVDTGTPIAGFQSFTTPGPGDTASPTNLPAISSASGDLVVESLAMRFNVISAFSRDGSQTEEINEFDDLFGGGGLKTSNKAGASSVTMQYTWAAGTEHYCMLGYNIKAAAGGPVNQIARAMAVIRAAWEHVWRYAN